MTDIEVRVCPMGRPRPRSETKKIKYAWCPECQRVRRSDKHCPMIQVDDDDG